jgi:hypothetical protein
VPHSGVAAFDKGAAIACRLRLAVKHQESAEGVIITLKEY